MIRCAGGEGDVNGVAYLLGFVEAVDLVKEDDRLSEYLKVRHLASTERIFQPSC